MKMESLAMKVNHPLATYGGIFVIVLNAEKKKPMMMIIQEEGRKKSTQLILKERYEASDSEVNLIGEPSEKFDYYVLYSRTRKQKTPPSPPCKETVLKEERLILKKIHLKKKHFSKKNFKKNSFFITFFF